MRASTWISNRSNQQQERRKIEEQYALALNNLVAKRSESESDLGSVQPPNLRDLD